MPTIAYSLFPANSLPQSPPTPIGPLLTESLATLLPDEVALETFNSQYLQRHSTSAQAILASAKVLLKLDAPRGEVESTVFTVFGPEVVGLNIKVCDFYLILV